MPSLTFVENKRKFFSLPNLHQGDISTKIGTVDSLRHESSVPEFNTNYTFLLENKKTLEDEFTQMFAVLRKQKDINDEQNEAFWLYCYYCATLLETFHTAYSQQAKADDYRKYKEKIKKHLEKEKEDKESEKKFIEALTNSFSTSFHNLISSPFHMSKLREYVAYSNICRVYWVFCRLTLTTGFSLARDLQLIDKLDAILGTHTDVDKIISVFQAPTKVLTYFSVGVFLMRFVIDFGLLLRHTLFPSDKEKEANTSAMARFKYELNKRHCNFTNDLVWGTVNFLTNFNQISHIPGPFTGAVTAVFLSFDLGMTLYKCSIAKQEYLVKKEQYLQEKKHYNELQDLDLEQKLLHLNMLDEQLKELEISWQKDEATFYFVASGAALLMFGFTTALLFSPPGMVMASFFVCMLATAMYLSADSYSQYKEKSLRLEHAKCEGQDVTFAGKEYDIARNDFIFTMTKNIVVPTFFLATFAICWPAAVALTAMYLGYELLHAYNQHEEKKELAQLALSF